MRRPSVTSNREGPPRAPAKFYRWINEIPAVFLIAMVLLAVLKPAT
jgi:uncharacterized membrane protein